MKKLTRIYAIEHINASGIADCIGTINYKVYQSLIRCYGVNAYNVARKDLCKQEKSLEVMQCIVQVKDYSVYKSARELYKML